MTSPPSRKGVYAVIQHENQKRQKSLKSLTTFDQKKKNYDKKNITKTKKKKREPPNTKKKGASSFRS